MSINSYQANLKAIAASAMILSLAACGGSGSYRVASVGSLPGDTATAGDNGGDGAGGSDTANGGAGATAGGGGMAGGGGSNTGTAGIPVGGRVLVSAGNAVIGASGRHDALAGKINGVAPGTTRVTGTVTTVLRRTGQSLVDLGNGQSLILNGAGGKLGEIVKIDLLSRTVVGAAAGSRLIGASVLSPDMASGGIASANVGNGGPLLAVGTVAAPASGVLTPVAGGVSSAASVTGLTGGAASSGSVGGTIIPATGTLTGKLTGTLAGGLTGKPRH